MQNAGNDEMALKVNRYWTSAGEITCSLEFRLRGVNGFPKMGYYLELSIDNVKECILPCKMVTTSLDERAREYFDRYADNYVCEYLSVKDFTLYKVDVS